jgi:hypothetical protein
VAPGGGTGTWFWVSAIAFLVFAVARYVIACRRSGRKVNPLPILLVLAAFGVGAVLQGTNSPWQFLILALVPAFFGWAWFRRKGTKLELGPSASAVDIWVEDLSPLSQVFPLRRGHARLFVDEGTIATRGLVTGGVTTSWLDFGALTFTFRAADCEVERPHMGVSSFSMSHGKPSIVLRGRGRRGGIVELA